MILSSVDAQIFESRRGVRALRYMDDFEFVVGSKDEATEVQVVLESALAAYQLALNAGKTSVEQLPQSLQRTWATELRRHSLGLGDEWDAKDIVGFFSSAFELAHRFESEPVLNFALACIRESDAPYTEGAQAVLEALMLQAMVAEPGTHRYVLDHFTTHGVIDVERLSEVLVAHIGENARAGHMNEVAWGLWAITSLELNVGRRLSGTIEHLRNDVVALLALRAQNKGFVEGIDVTGWRAIVTMGSLYGPHWLLTYESLVNNLLSPSDRTAAFLEDDFFSALRESEVSFFAHQGEEEDQDDDEDDDGGYLDDDDDDGLFEPASAWEDAYSP